MVLGWAPEDMAHSHLSAWIIPGGGCRCVPPDGPCRGVPVPVRRHCIRPGSPAPTGGLLALVWLPDETVQLTRGPARVHVRAGSSANGGTPDSLEPMATASSARVGRAWRAQRAEKR